MFLLIKLALYGSAGLLLLAANIWYCLSVRRLFDTKAVPDVIAPFQVIGKDDDGRSGRALAQMLQGWLSKARDDVNASVKVLKQPLHPSIAHLRASATLAVGGSEPAEAWAHDFRLPSAPVALEMTVAGVEVGGFISWAHRTLSEERALEVVIQYHADGYATVTGNIELEPGRRLRLERAGPSEDDIVRDVSYAIAHQEFARHIPEAKPLSASEFQRLIDTLGKIAELNRTLTARADAWAAQLPALDELVTKMSDWVALLRLAAKVAENAREVPKAIAYYARELELRRSKLPPAGDRDPAIVELDAAIAHLREQFSRDAAEASVGATPVRAPADLIRAMVGVEPAKLRRQLRIGVVGSAPLADTLAPEQMTVLRQDPIPPRDDSTAEYLSMVVQAVQLVAPDVHFIFDGKEPEISAASYEPWLIDSIGQMLASSQKPDVLLIPFRLTQVGLGIELLLDKAANSGIAVVAPAGNEPSEPFPFADSPLLDRILVVAAIDTDGQPTAFTQRHDKAFWAPGTQIPMLAPGSGQVIAQAGTAFSAAIGAGVVARLLDSHPKLRTTSLVHVLHSTAKPIGGAKNAPPVLNLAETLAVLGS
ncbi:MAG TPA: S8/S53 family peptidase [Polyangiaceae bacterium]|nr:S8/S53 family peptidase [Polyangiaceae bacterium]